MKAALAEIKDTVEKLLLPAVSDFERVLPK
jgi:hypothetical protein